MAGRIYTPEEQAIIYKVKTKLPHICYYCNKTLNTKDITIDHKTPLSRGGLTVEENLAISCYECNSEKDDMTELEYNIYKKKQQELQETFEVNIVIKNLISVQDNILNRIDQIRGEFTQVERQLKEVKDEILYNDFSASEGYKYAKRYKELLNKRNELCLLKEQYNNLRGILGSHKKQINDLAQRVSLDIYNESKPIIRKQVTNTKIKVTKNKPSNVIELKSVVNE